MGLTASTKKPGVHSFTCSSLTVYTFPSFFCVSCGYPLLLSNSIHAKHTSKLSYSLHQETEPSGGAAVPVPKKVSASYR